MQQKPQDTTGRGGRPLASRLRDAPATTIFTEMSALAARTGAVNLGQGFPDADGPPAVLDAAAAALRGGANQYAPGRGVPALQRAVAAHQQRHYGIELDPATQVVITTGATEAIAAAVLGLVEPGDEVVLLEPFYDSYPAAIDMAGGVRVPVPLSAPDWRLDVAALEAAVTDRSRLLLLNTPHNPTGTVLTRDELEAVARVAVEHDLIVVTDEVYEHLVFDGSDHLAPATLPGLADRTISIDSAGKTFNVTGWKVGWATGPAHLVDAVFAAKQWLTFSSAAPLQPAVALALEEHEGFHRELAASLAARRDLLVDGLRDLGLEVRSAEGTYFVLTDIAAWGWPDGRAFCDALPDRAGVVAIPAQAFYELGADSPGRHLVRWAFCKDEPVIVEGVRRLREAYEAGRLHA